MNFVKTARRASFLFLIFLPVCLMSQEIRGLKIFVDLAAGTYLKFPKPIEGIEGNFREKGYNFKNRSGGNALNIVPPTDRVLEMAEIEISEGGRNHLFLITPYPKKYDPNIDPPFDYIFDNTDKLKRYAQQAEHDRANVNAVSQPETKPASPTTNTVTETKPSTKPGNELVPPSPKPGEVKPPPVVDKPVSDGYDAAIVSGDKAFNEKNYFQAKQYYTDAMRIRVNEKYPFNRIQQIIKIEEEAEASIKREEEKQKAIDASYTQELQKADRYLLNNELSLARGSYSKALEIKSGESYPKNKIAEVDSLVKDLLAKQEAQRLADEQEKKRLAAELEVTNKYKAAVSRGDKAFAAGKYDEARIAYSDAQKIKPSEKYPDQKLTEIAEVQNAREAAAAEKLIRDREKELNAKYDALMEKGNQAFNNKLYESAKSSYNAALALKPNDKPASDKLLETDDAINKAKAAELEKASLAKQKAIDDAYTAAVQKADKAYSTKNFETAKTEYYNAQKLKPAELYPQTKLTEIEKEQNEMAAKVAREKEAADSYKKAIANADKAFAAKSYTDAKLAYNEALSIKDNDAYARGKITAIEKIEEDLSIKASQAALKALNDRYDSVIAIADKQYAAKDYTKAKETYNEAIELIPNKTYPNSQIKLIARKEYELAEQEKTNKFNELVAKGDQEFSAKSYDAAKGYYTQAIEIRPDETYPKKQIAIINDPGELERIGKREELNTYNQLVNEGDKAFKEGKFDLAKTNYQKANDIKRDVPYVTFKINQVNDTVNAIAEAEVRRQRAEAQKAMDDKFNGIVADADKAFAAGDFTGSKKLYNDALAVKPDDNSVKDKITSVNKAIKQKEDEAAALVVQKQKEEELNRKFTAWVQKGDESYNSKQYDAALSAYDSAVLLKPDDKYIKGQIALIDKTITAAADSVKQSETAKIKREETEANYASAIERADKAFDAKLYFEAKSGYNDALAIKAGEKHPADRLKEIETELARESAAKNTAAITAKPVINATTDKSASTTTEVSKKATPANNTVVPASNAVKSRTAPQSVALPYTQAEFYKRYNTINFREPPVGQKYVADAFFAEDTLENFNTCQSILQEPPRLDISDSANNVKITLQAINFEGSKAYLKIRVQNFGTKEFLTGRMLFTWYRKTENKVDYYGTYISAFPYVLPGKEFTLVYSCRSANPSEGEQFEFTMDDRLKTTRLSIKIPSEVYIAEYDR